MPKAWSEDEKARIKNTLIEEGRKLFDKYGLQKTTVEEIAKASGVSKGAFYHFYPSKEELYFAILEDVEQVFREQVYQSLTTPGGSRRASFRLFLEKIVDTLVSSPFYRQMDSATLQYFMRKLSPEVVQQHMTRDRDYLLEHLEIWMKNGWMRRVNADALMGVLLSLVGVVVNRDELAAPGFEATKELLLDMITEYLIPEE